MCAVYGLVTKRAASAGASAHEPDGAGGGATSDTPVHTLTPPCTRAQHWSQPPYTYTPTRVLLSSLTEPCAEASCALASSSPHSSVTHPFCADETVLIYLYMVPRVYLYGGATHAAFRRAISASATWEG